MKKQWPNNKIKQLRKERDMTMAQLAAQCGTSAAVIHAAEHGGNVSLATAINIASVFNRSIEEVWMTRSERMSLRSLSRCLECGRMEFAHNEDIFCPGGKCSNKMVIVDKSPENIAEGIAQTFFRCTGVVHPDLPCEVNRKDYREYIFNIWDNQQ